jgi:hypothetical protein
MTTFHSRQSDDARRTRKNENADTFNFAPQIPPSICTVMVTKCEKPCATIFHHGVIARFSVIALMRCKPYPLSKQGFYGSPIARRKLRGVPRDDHAMDAQHPARHPAQYPRHVPAMAGQWQRPCRRASVKMTRKTTCLAPDLDAPCPRWKLARRLASNLNHDIQKL